jgi:NADP-dependent 3-hydroxy acid dehydrogenase YdfG
MAKSLNGKVVLITGASSGFGQDAACLFARQGCKVVLAARRLDRLQDLAERVRSQGGEALAVPVDVTQRQEIKVMVQTTLDVYGRIDILFNNAGFGRLDWLEALDPERDIETQIAVNLTGLMLVTRAVLPHMLERRAGHIIHMSSVAGYISAPLYSVYSATKFGVRAFTDALRREVAPFGIKVSGIYPGPAATEFGQHTGNHAIKRSFKTPAWMSLSSKAVARRVVWLAAHPRRAVVVPWWFRPVFWADALFPALVDWVIQMAFVRRFHRP